MEEKWTQLWLKYRKCKDNGNSRLVKEVSVKGFDNCNRIIASGLNELRSGLFNMLDTSIIVKSEVHSGLEIVKENSIVPEGYYLKGNSKGIRLEASDEKGALYGIFHILRWIAMEKSLEELDVLCKPDNPLRMYNHWDNMDGSIERGYSGDSFFFKDGEILINCRIRDYVRFVASIGINAVVINNVNVKDDATWLITDRYFSRLADLAELFADYGVQLFLSLNYAAPMELSNLHSADPLDENVIAWWKSKIAEVYDNIPNFGGFLVKADSEGRPGPFTYGRTQADGANMLADIIKPYGGLIIWRCFVYNCTQDWRDYKTDRAKAGYDNFITLDGKYHQNVILQIKNGPMDFQIREPVSPLLGGLKKTNQMLEVQVAQEYTGQQIDLCYLIPMFKEILEFKTYCKEENDSVADIVSGRTFGNKNAGMAAVCNTGNDANWTGNELAAANFYGFGRLAFSTKLTAAEIAEEWVRLTISNEDFIVNRIVNLLLHSRKTYEKYTSPLGIGWMVTPHYHYGPSVDGYEYSKWGTYHRADNKGIGVDRSKKGTGYAEQYYEPNASLYNAIETCPEELLLFFHHVSYDYVLSSGKTLIQHIYDTHFEGVEEVLEMIAVWENLRDNIPEDTYKNVHKRMECQLENAREWRDQINTYFYRKSGISDEKRRTIY